MESSTCIGGLAFLPTRLLRCNGCRRSAPELIGGGVASKRLPLVRRLPGSSWSQLRRRGWARTTGASAATNPTAQPPVPAMEEERDCGSRNLSNFEPSIWGDFFLTYSSPLACSSQQTRMIERADQLKKELSKTIAASSNCSLYERMHLIDILERLCLDHLFEEEINVVLTQINNADVSGCDLQTVALWFYLFRKHGYRVSPDVLAKFRDDEHGSFAANNPSDILVLYNAAYLRTDGEIILDEAISFTKRCLESIVPHMEGPLAREMKCALEIPVPRRVRIYEAKYYISTYGKESKDDEVVMELAKLNFNLMQLQHQEELKIITRWWNDLELQSRLWFARDRVVECYFWMVGVYFEPSYSRGRIILTKLGP